MIRNRYSILKESIQINNEGITYPDIMTFPIKNFKFFYIPREYTVTEPDIDRFYMICYKAYGVAFYDDIVLWLNNIASPKDLNPGDTILIPDKRDLDRFFITYLKER